MSAEFELVEAKIPVRTRGKFQRKALEESKVQAEYTFELRPVDQFKNAVTELIDEFLESKQRKMDIVYSEALEGEFIEAILKVPYKQYGWVILDINHKTQTAFLARRVWYEKGDVKQDVDLSELKEECQVIPIISVDCDDNIEVQVG
jgi:hypothetical protein